MDHNLESGSHPKVGVVGSDEEVDEDGDKMGVVGGTGGNASGSRNSVKPSTRASLSSTERHVWYSDAPWTAGLLVMEAEGTGVSITLRGGVGGKAPSEGVLRFKASAAILCWEAKRIYALPKKKGAKKKDKSGREKKEKKQSVRVRLVSLSIDRLYVWMCGSWDGCPGQPLSFGKPKRVRCRRSPFSVSCPLLPQLYAKHPAFPSPCRAINNSDDNQLPL